MPVVSAVFYTNFFLALCLRITSGQRNTANPAHHSGDRSAWPGHLLRWPFVASATLRHPHLALQAEACCRLFSDPLWSGQQVAGPELPCLRMCADQREVAVLQVVVLLGVFPRQRRLWQMLPMLNERKLERMAMALQRVRGLILSRVPLGGSPRKQFQVAHVSTAAP